MECMLASQCIAEHIKIFLKETGILGMCMGVRVLDISPSSSLFRSLFSLLFIYFIAIIQLRVCYHSFSFLSFQLILILTSSFSFYTHCWCFSHSLISYYNSPQRSSACALSLKINLNNEMLMHLENKRMKQSYF